MKRRKLDEFHRGWFIGDFEPSLLRTKDFEIGILDHKKDEIWPSHIHYKADEYNVLIAGVMLINGKFVFPGEMFVIEKGEIATPVFVTDCKLVVVKVPSVIGDKFET